MSARKDIRTNIKEIKPRSRHIGAAVTLELWARSAGRCEFRGCNRLLYKSSITQQSGNFGERAHIWAFAEDGPRGRPKEIASAGLNDSWNLMLMCQGCHKLIDSDKKGILYSAVRLREWKEEHERRIARVTGIEPKRASQSVVYTAKIDIRKISIDQDLIHSAMFPQWYPSNEHPIRLCCSAQMGDRNAAFWDFASQDLKAVFRQRVQPLLDDGHQPLHYSLFGFAPIPLLILFGSLFSDKVRSEIYQWHRDIENWAWPKSRASALPSLEVHQPTQAEGRPAIILSLSDKAVPPTGELTNNLRIWEIRASKPSVHLIRSRRQIVEFSQIMRKVLSDIGNECGKGTPILFFPAIPLSCAIALGRLRLDKIDSPWVIYDYHNANGGFTSALTIGDPS